MLSPEDQGFARRIQSGIDTAKAWDADPSLLEKCRSQIPFEDLMNPSGDYCRDDDYLYHGNALFLKRLTVFFQSSMTWVNAPVCKSCGKNENMELKGTRGSETDEEREGGASRVELYSCSACNNDTITTFPRYNSVRKLLETRCGRCGEYANLFGLFCRAAGFETRYILDVTDHVWIEAFVDGTWIMADGCEGIIDKPSMYEDGWGKKLCYNAAVAVDHVVDVTPRYTRQWNDDAFQARRRNITSSESVSERIFQQLNETLRKDLHKNRLEELTRRAKREEQELAMCRQATAWREAEKHGRGRISGSLAWKVARQEAGTNKESSKPSANEEEKESTIPNAFQVESFFPCAQEISITVHPTPSSRHEGIVVSGAACCVGEPNCVSVVVVDEQFLGCVLQSQSFQSLSTLTEFVHKLPEHRIVVMNGTIPEAAVNPKIESVLMRLGGFDPKLLSSGILYMGQIQAHPDWTFCSASSACPDGYRITIVPKTTKQAKLRTERSTKPNAIAGRLPEHIMPIGTQILATNEQKRAAFLSFVENNKSRHYVGYTTKPSTPVYLLDAKSYPFEVTETDQDWNTFHFLPPPLVPKDDVGIVDDPSPGIEFSKVDVPLDVSFFEQQLGPVLLTKSASGASERTPTAVALRNSRLVGIYFSAHWCGPCRMFTPMLAELYSHLKETYPSHGLEIVFASSDRDASSFQQYFASMPWLAIPFEAMASLKAMLSTRYGVRGIPSFVVLDAVSGQTVISSSESRQEVSRACQGGEDRIEKMLLDWLDRIPHETKDIMRLLELSCSEDTVKRDTTGTDHPYLVRKEDAKPNGGSNGGSKPASTDASARVKQIFAKLVQDGMAPNEAAAKAIAMVAEKQKGVPSTDNTKLSPGPLDGLAKSCTPSTDTSAQEKQVISDVESCNNAGRRALRTVLTTAQKYIKNAKKEPWTPKFRSFKLSNKVADRITRVEGAIQLLRYLKFEVFGTQQDFVMSIPLGENLDHMDMELDRLLDEYPDE